MDESGAKIVSWLQNLPPGAEIRWCSIDLAPEEPWARKWVDITIECYRPEEAGSWVFTIETPFREPAEALWYIQTAYDLDVHAVSNADYKDGDFALAYALPTGTPITAEQDAALEAALSAEPGRRRGRVGAWSPTKISQAMAEWCHLHAGRADVQFVWDDQANAVEFYPELLAALEHPEDSYVLAPNVQVSDGVMNFMLEQEPEEAAALSELFQALNDPNIKYDPFAE